MQNLDSWWSRGHPWHGAVAVLLSVTKGKSYQWNSVPSLLVHWMHKEIETNKKKAKWLVPWLLSVIAKMKLEENAGSDLDTRPSSLLSESELWPLPSVLAPMGKLCKDYRKCL